MPRDWYAGTRIEKQPDVVGSSGVAWRVDIEKARLANPERNDFKGAVALWIVHVPTVSTDIVWDHWLYAIIHLRDIENIPARKKEYPDATHEASIIAIDPAYALPDPDDFNTLHYLSPLDFLEQCRLDNDAQAYDVLQVLVTLACDGDLHPDSHFSQRWISALWQTASRVRRSPGVRLQ